MTRSVEALPDEARRSPLRGWLSRARGSGFLRTVAVLAGGVALSRLIVAATSPVLTRLYGPEDLGRLAAFVAFVNVAAVAASLRYDLGIVSAATARDAAYLVFTSLAISVPMALLLAGLLAALGAAGAWRSAVLSPGWALLLAPALVLTVAFTVLRYQLLRTNDFRFVSTVTIVQNAGRSVAQVVLGAFGAGVSGLVAGELLGRGLGIGRMLRRVLPGLRRDLAPFDLGTLRRVVADYRKFPLYSLPSSLLDALTLNMVTPLIAQLYGANAAGQFALVQLLFSLPLALVGSAAGDAFHSRIAQIAREDRGQATAFFLRTSGGLLAGGAAPVVAIAGLAPLAVSWVFGNEWRPAGRLAVAVAPWALAQLVVSPVSQVMFVFRRQELKLVYDAVTLAALGGALFWAHAHGLSVVSAVTVLSAAAVLTYVLYFFLLLSTVRRVK